jgi:hypothetical protein
MAAQRGNRGFAFQHDYANTIIRQRNACPICHLPLCYGLGGDIQNSDSLWNDIQEIMKINVPNNTLLFGKESTAVNAEVCHLVATTMIAEISKPLLYQTPVCTQPSFQPENGMYLYPAIQRTRRLFSWNLRALFADPSIFRIARASEYLSLNGVNYFVACADCNMSHTGNHQIQSMISIMFNRHQAAHADIFCMYTLMFDCMADTFNVGNLPTINITAERAKTWQLELWLNYCTLMLMAQMHKHELSTKNGYMGDAKYRFLHAHRDMGMCDFYMNQILCLILYVRFDIEMDFIWLHQNFMVFIPEWAKASGHYRTNIAVPGGGQQNNDYSCMWRWVLGTPVNNSVRGVRVDLSDPYWYVSRDFNAMGTFIVDRVTDFAAKWLYPIGLAIKVNNAGLFQEMTALYQKRCSDQCKVLLKSVRLAPIGHDQFQYVMMRNPTLSYIHNAFKQIYGPRYKYVLYDNFMTLAFRRTCLAYRNAQVKDQGTIQRFRIYVMHVDLFMRSIV